MTTQPNAPSLQDPTNVPILGISGAITSEVSVPTGNLTPQVTNSEFYVGTFTVGINNKMNEQLFRYSFPSPPGSDGSRNPTWMMLRYLTSVNVRFLGLNVGFRSNKISDSECRMETNLVYFPGGLFSEFLNTPQNTHAYSVRNEISIINPKLKEIVHLDFASFGSEGRTWNPAPTVGSWYPNPLPKTDIYVHLLSLYQPTPMHPDSFEVLVYVDPILDFTGYVVPMYKQLSIFTPYKTTPIAGVAQTFSLTT